LRPVKEEQLLDEPTILLFHDIVSDTDIEKMKVLATPQVNNVSIYIKSSRLNDKNLTIVEINSYAIVAACFGVQHYHQYWNTGQHQNQ
jgi:hypothetical protein